jgi:hypothetical protein
LIGRTDTVRSDTKVLAVPIALTWKQYDNVDDRKVVFVFIATLTWNV